MASTRGKKPGYCRVLPGTGSPLVQPVVVAGAVVLDRRHPFVRLDVGAPAGLLERPAAPGPPERATSGPGSPCTGLWLAAKGRAPSSRRGRPPVLIAGGRRRDVVDDLDHPDPASDNHHYVPIAARIVGTMGRSGGLRGPDGQSPSRAAPQSRPRGENPECGGKTCCLSGLVRLRITTPAVILVGMCHPAPRSILALETVENDGNADHVEVGRTADGRPLDPREIDHDEP